MPEAPKRRRGERITWDAKPSARKPKPPAELAPAKPRQIRRPKPQPPAPQVVEQSGGAAKKRFSNPPPTSDPSTGTAPSPHQGGTQSAGPVCGRTWEGQCCQERGKHVCEPRVAHIAGFFANVLVHTKGRWAHQPFILAAWQLVGIVRPLFGTVVWSDEAQRYVRQYSIAWIELGRKNGKSELLAGIALYLLVADDESGAELYGCARDREQARKVFDVAERMVKLSTVLTRRLKVYTAAKRIVDERTGSWYEIVAADALGNLGHNPHGILFDEIIAQRDSSLWNAMRTAMGARDQPLMVAATTAGDDENSFAAAEHLEMQKILDEPDRSPHIFVFMRNMPADADPWDEAGWPHANPALGTFLSMQTLRNEAQEARNDPSKENAFRQFRLNQWVNQASRWMPMHLWDLTAGDLWDTPDEGREILAGLPCFAGFDLAAKFDLTSWCLAFPTEDEHAPIDFLWRFWLPEAGLRKLDKLNDGKFTRWAKAGWLTVTEGNVIDYDRVIADIAEDAAAFHIRAADGDEWSMWPIINRVADTCGLDAEGGEMTVYKNTYERMSPGMDDLLGLVRGERLHHHGNPVARFCFDVCTVRRAPYDPNLVRPAKPERGTDKARIDAVATAAMATNAMRGHAAGPMRVSSYEEAGLMVI